MSESNRRPRDFSPLAIYVVFHPDSVEARRLADHLHDWFRLKTDDGERSESGLPVWYRCALGAKPAITPKIKWREAECNVVVVLGDRHLVADRAWRHALEKLHKHAVRMRRRAVLLPVEMDAALYQLAFLTADRNAVRIGDPVQLPEANDGDDSDWEAAVGERARRLRRAVTESVARELLDDRQGASPDNAPKRMKVFLSHAKRDGLRIAERLRDSLASYGQLEVWFDANDLPAGYAWARPMRHAAGELAALVSVVTDAYPSRPWCRTEVDLARRPWRVPIPDSKEGPVDVRASLWRVQPTIAVHSAGASWSRPMAQLVHVPAIGWDEAEHVVARRIADVADRLVLEIMVAAFQERVGMKLARDLEMVPQSAELVHVAFLTFVPEPRSLIYVLSELLRPNQDNPDEKPAGDEPRHSRDRLNKVWIAYPGHSLRTLEQRELQQVADRIAGLIWESRTPTPDKSDRLRIELVSQEGLERQLQGAGTRPQPDFAVCLSGGGDDVGLARDGVGMPHVDDLFVQLARRLLEVGCTLVYGGSLADLRQNLTLSLMDAARGWVRDTGSTDSRDRPPPTAEQLDEPPFVNYSPWPHTRHVQLEHDADYVGICRFERVFPPGVSRRELDRLEADESSPEAVVRAAEALEAMRRMTSAPDKHPLRIVLGGKVRGFTGLIPGIADEVLHALDAGQIPVILGGFGGCASLLGEFLAAADDEPAWPDELTFEACCMDGPLAALCRIPACERMARERFGVLKDRMEALRRALRGEVLGSAESPFRVPGNETASDARARDANVALFSEDGSFRGSWTDLLRQQSPTLALRGVLEIVQQIADKRGGQPSENEPGD